MVDTVTSHARRDRTHWLYIGVIAAVVAGVVVGLVAPQVGKSVGILGTMFVSLIKMMIAPVIFCTIVLGVGAVRKAATVGRIGGLAFLYFLVTSVPPAASVPVALAAAAAPTIVSTVPSIRPSEPAMKVPVVVAAAPSAPGSAAAVSPDVADEATPAAPKQSAVELADQSEPVAVPTAPRVVHRGAAESAGDAGPAVAKPAAGHRGASDAPSAAAARTGH